MAIRIPGTNIKIGKGKADKKKVLDAAYKRVLRSPSSDQSKVTWPDMPSGADPWYDPKLEHLRRASASGYMREAEQSLGDTPNFKLLFDQLDSKTGKVGERAWSSSAGEVNMPTDLGGYMSKPQYLATVLAHEVAHNKDWVKNRPAIGHNKETFRPYERDAARAAQIEPQYDPGDDVTGVNEYPDRYMPIGKWNDRYYMSNRVDDPTRSIFPVTTKDLERALVQRRKNVTSASNKSGLLPGVGRAQASLT